ncbi:nucleoside transporter-domain-containing protein [Zopfochytrium polystomum]|nr:nucleoside transporter-domain-containing protein [Zopfochytrium polystomum]
MKHNAQPGGSSSSRNNRHALGGCRPPSPPPLRAWTLWAAFLIVGVASRIGWNTWINARPFLHFRLAPSPVLRDMSTGGIAACYFAGNIIFLLGIFAARRQLLPRTRIVAGLSLSILLLVAGAALAALSHRLSPAVLFSLSLLLVLLTSLAESLILAALGLVAEFRAPILAQAVSIGQGIAGLIPAVGSVALLVVVRRGTTTTSVGGGVGGLDPDAGNAVKKFCASLVVTVAALVAFLLLVPTPRVRQALSTTTTTQSGDQDELITSKRTLAGALTAAASDHRRRPRPAKASPLSVLAQIRLPVAAVFLNFAVTYALYPATTSTVETVDNGAVVSSNGPGRVNDRNVFAALGFLVFNVGDILGKAAPALPAFYWTSDVALFAASLARLVFVPLLLLCNVGGGSATPAEGVVVVLGDPVFLALVCLLGATGGWLGSAAAMWAPERARRRSGRCSPSPRLDESSRKGSGSDDCSRADGSKTGGGQRLVASSLGGGGVSGRDGLKKEWHELGVASHAVIACGHCTTLHDPGGTTGVYEGRARSTLFCSTPKGGVVLHEVQPSMVGGDKTVQQQHQHQQANPQWRLICPHYVSLSDGLSDCQLDDRTGDYRFAWKQCSHRTTAFFQSSTAYLFQENSLPVFMLVKEMRFSMIVAHCASQLGFDISERSSSAVNSLTQAPHEYNVVHPAAGTLRASHQNPSQQSAIAGKRASNHRSGVKFSGHRLERGAVAICGGGGGGVWMAVISYLPADGTNNGFLPSAASSLLLCCLPAPAPACYIEKRLILRRALEWSSVCGKFTSLPT